MGFMRRKKNSPAEGAYITVISQGTKLVGELTLDAKLHIDGVFEGTIVSTSEVSIGASGFVKGTLTAQKILVSGFAQGDINCDCLEVIGSGKVFGDVTCVDLVIEPGGRFVGTSHIKDPAGEQAALPDRSTTASSAPTANPPRPRKLRPSRNPPLSRRPPPRPNRPSKPRPKPPSPRSSRSRHRPRAPGAGARPTARPPQPPPPVPTPPSPSPPTARTRAAPTPLIRW